MLHQFLGFIQERRLAREEIFTLETLRDFKASKGIVYATALRGFARYLFAQKRIPTSLSKPVRKLVGIYEDYLDRIGICIFSE